MTARCVKLQNNKYHWNVNKAAELMLSLGWALSQDFSNRNFSKKPHATYLTNLCGNSGLWDIFILYLYCFGFTNFSRCLFLLQLEDVTKIWMYNCTFRSLGYLHPSFKDETSKENSWNRCRSYWLPLVSQIFLDVSSLSFSFLQMLMLY